MKKCLPPLLAGLLVLAALLAACSSRNTSAGSTAGNGALTGNGNQPLSKAAQLLLGTLKLEGTPNAVDANEAADLLPLWRAYSQLMNSDSAAQAEIDGLVTQIQGTMTPAQVQAITAMKLTQQDVFTTMGTLGFAPSSANNPSATSTPQTSINANGGGFAGGAGGPPAGGGAPSGGGGAPAGPVGGGDAGAGELAAGGTGQTSSTPVANSPARTNGIPPALLNALIELLQKRSQT